VPTAHPRIQVTNDSELAEALARVARFYTGKPASQVVRDLAIKGAEAVEREHGERAAAIGRLIALTDGRRELVDWDILERIDEVAWGYPPE
jgi:hypothetical protein